MTDVSKQAADLQTKYGFDVVYDPKSNMYKLYQGKNDLILSEREIDFDTWNDSHLDDMGEKFSENTTIEYKDVDLCSALHNDELLYSAAYDGENHVLVYNYKMDENNRNECVQMFIEKYKLSEEEAKKRVEFFTEKSNPTSLFSLIEHEMAHLEDDKSHGNRQFDLPPKYMAKLNMMTEVKANLVQAGLALDMYKATGDVKYFDNLVAIDTKELQKTLSENPNMENKEAYVAKYVNDKWLETHNQSRYDEKTQQTFTTPYSQQAFWSSVPIANDYPVWATEENPNTINQYHERVDAMFENIVGLGDVRKYVTPDFELTDGVKQELAKHNIIRTEALKKIMCQDAQNAEKYAKNLKAYFNRVKTVDADGVRTPEEVAMLDEYIKNSIQRYDAAHASPIPQAEKTPQKGSDFTTISAIKKSRGGR
ncbi:MAG: hypothetical protein IKN71_09020 [Alphaproteobacteria bacterium]|nr:hypothetical protein [Alphaproteobacteria bacterium]